MKIYCCGCQKEVVANMLDGEEIWPRRQKLYGTPYWQCPTCKNHVGCQSDGLKPVGHIPTQEMLDAREHIHAVLDPIWQSGAMTKKAVHTSITHELGWPYDPAMIRTVCEARQVYKAALKVRDFAHSLKQSVN